MCKQRAIHFLRILALIEGVSFLLLLFVGMPLKYGLAMPLGVKVLGWIHGVLFAGFCLGLVLATLLAGWRMRRGLLLLTAALLPFGPFFVDGRFPRYLREAEGDSLR
jgi:integral membrane protein